MTTETNTTGLGANGTAGNITGQDVPVTAGNTTSTERREVTVAWSEEEKAFRAFLDDNMAGHSDVKDAIVEILAAIRNPLRDPNAPIYSVLMCGPSTSGKTLGFKLLVEWVHGSRDKMVFVSGSDYEEKHQLQKLIGAPPGYIGYVDVKDPKYVKPKPGEPDDSAILSQHNLDNSRMGCKDDIVFILFDEWEKFHFAFNRFMLRPLREGTGELNNTQRVNFKNVVMGFTSNLGSSEIEKRATPMGFVQREKKYVEQDEVRSIVVRELVKGYPPEFRNRINKVLFFAGLSDKELLRVVDLELKTLNERIIALGTSAFILRVDDNAKEWLLANGDDSDSEKSALPAMQAKLKLHLEAALGQLLKSGQIRPGDVVEVTHTEGEEKLRFFISPDPLAHLAPDTKVVKDEPELAPAPTSEGASEAAAGNSAAAASGGEQVPQATLVLLLRGDTASTGNGGTEAPSTEGIVVNEDMQPFRLVIEVPNPAQLESISQVVRAGAAQLPDVLITEYTVNLMSGYCTVEVMATLQAMKMLRATFRGLRIIALGYELS